MTIYTLTKSWSDPQQQKLAQWTADMMGACEAQARELMVSTEMVVGQAALESSWGRAAIGHNIFGIKADSRWKGPVLMQRTAEQNPDGSVYFIVAPFRDYPTYQACIDDHFAFLKENANYAEAGVFTAHSDLGYAEALKRADYATDVNYVDLLMGMAKSVRLYSAFMDRSDTAPAIAAMPAPPRLLLIGLQGPDVTALQEMLAKLGLQVGTPDGQFGPMTRAAVMAFQKAHDLTADGVVGQQTRAILGL